MHSMLSSTMIRGVCLRQVTSCASMRMMMSSTVGVGSLDAMNQQMEVMVESNKVKLTSLLKTLPAKMDTRTHLRVMEWLNDREHDCRYIYAKKDGALAGFALLHKADDMTVVTEDNRANTPSYLLDMVYALPQYRGVGLGSHLLANARQTHGRVTTFVQEEGHMEALFKAGYKQAMVSAPKGTAVFMYP